MNIPAFFRFLNRKIEKYDKTAVNPFLDSGSFIIIWVEDSGSEPDKDENIIT